MHKLRRDGRMGARKGYKRHCMPPLTFQKEPMWASPFGQYA